jgi:hypothetical protein
MTKYTLRRFCAGAAILGAISAALVGCNGSDDGGPVTSPTATATATTTPGLNGTPAFSAFYPGNYTVRVTSLDGAVSSFNFTVNSAGVIRSRSVSSGLGNGTFSGTVSPEGGLSATLAAQGRTVKFSGTLPSMLGTASTISATASGSELPGTVSVARQ